MKKCISLLLCLCLIMTMFAAIPASAEQRPITVLLDGQPLTFDVPPVIMNSRTMVPMRAIFEALGAKVQWSAENETVVGMSKSDKRVTTTIGSDIAIVEGEPVKIDAPPVIVNGRTLVPLRFISENFDCEVGWNADTYTVSIKDNQKDSASITKYYTNAHFATFGCWVQEGSYGLKGKTTSPDDSGLFFNETNDDAILNFNIDNAGKYKVWVLSKDYPTNRPGTRFFHVAVDGVRSDVKFGAHGQKDYAWQEAGTYDFAAGQHTVNLQDTSAYYARCGGIIVTGDMNFVPPVAQEEYLLYYADDGTKSDLIPAQYPLWAVRAMTDTATETIENDKIKMVFYHGVGERGGLVQNEIYVKKGNDWQLVKARTEELGVLAMRANDAPLNTTRPAVDSLADLPKTTFSTAYDGFEKEINMPTTKDFYKSGKPEWLIPTSMWRDGDAIVLGMSSENVEATLTFKFDDLCKEPKVTLNSTMKQNGAYSFVFFTGNEFEDGSFDRVIAPLTYVKDFVPKENLVLSEYMMFTPMVAFTFGEGENAITQGVVVDPTCVRQDVASPGRSDFGLMFRSPNGYVRGQLVAPLMNNQGSIFNAGDTYNFSYRIIYSTDDWYENYIHVAEDIYNCKDIRTNYYHSLNEAIYNTTDLIMDDIYGGWDDKDMGFYNMEANRVVTHSNVIELAQRYALTDDEELLEERVIPSVAYALSRGGKHFKRTEGSNSYTSVAPTPLAGPDTSISPAAYIGMYQISQGRTPYLLNLAVNAIENGSHLGVVAGYDAMNDMFPDEKYVEELKARADKFIDAYLTDPESTFNNKPFVGGFISDDTNNMLNAFIQAYEATGEQKYLDAAETAARFSILTLWTTGYQNDYATTTYTVDPVKTAERPLANDAAQWYYHKDGTQWRVGNPVGVNSKASEAQNKLKEESAPGWVPARTGMTTEHLMTPSNANAITMNMWAGTMLRMAKYTGDEFFLTQARNAIIGKFGNYGGYYWERYLLHDKQASYPYDGPDYDLIYWHHIPVFLGLIEDFLVNDVWFRSDSNIEFPSVVNSGYAYFITNQYGFKPGKFYDEDGMWLWLDRGIAEPDSVEVNYLTAKKKNTLGIALVNEGQNSLKTTVTLGDKIPNAAAYSETATLYDKAGNKSTVEIVNGKFTVTIPGRDIVSVVLHPDVDVPAFAKDYIVSNTLGDTYKVFKSGKAHVLQFNDNNYYAYIYTTRMPKDTKSVAFEYVLNGKTETKVIDEYPFETIIKVPADKELKFKVIATGLDGSTEVLTESNVLKPISMSKIEPYTYGAYEEEPIICSLPEFNAFDLKIPRMGTGNGVLRIVVQTDDLIKGIGLEKLENGDMTGAKIKSVLVNKDGNGTVLIESVITGNEVLATGETVLLVKPTADAPLESYDKLCKLPANAKIIPSNGKFSDFNMDGQDQAVVPEKPAEPTAAAIPEFEPFNVTYTTQGVAASSFRFVTPLKDYPFDVAENLLKGLKVTMVMTDRQSGESNVYECVIEKNEMRDGLTVIQFKAPEGVKATDYDNDKAKTHKFTLTVSKADAKVEAVIPDAGSVKEENITAPESFDSFTVKPVAMGSTANLRAVCNLSDFPFKVAEKSLNGLKVKINFTHDGKAYSYDSEVVLNEARGEDKTVLNLKAPEIQKMFTSDAEWSKFRPEIVFLGK